MTPPIIALLDSWPKPSSSSEVVLFATETQLLLRYSTSTEEYAVIQFPLVKIFKFGAPNDEALGGHPLTQFGLKFYSVHRVDNSPWITELEQKNTAHPSHNKDRFLKDIVHYLFTFQDSTLECVVYEGNFWKPKIKVFLSKEEAKSEWCKLIKEIQ